MEERNSIILNVWFAFIAVYICFRHFLINDNYMYVIMNMFFLAVVLNKMRERFKIKQFGCWGIFAILIFDMFFSGLYAMSLTDAIKFSVLFLNFWLIGFVFMHIKNWQLFFFKWLKAGCLFHLFFTYLSVFFKEKAHTYTYTDENNHYSLFCSISHGPIYDYRR